MPGEDEHKPGRSDGYDFGFLHIKVLTELNLFSSFFLFSFFRFSSKVSDFFTVFHVVVEMNNETKLHY